VLAQIGYLAGVSGRPPGEIARISQYERDFWEYWSRRERAADEDRFWTKMGRHLGTTWERADFDEQRPGGSGNPDHAFFPLATLVGQGDVWTAVKKSFTKKTRIDGYVAQKGEQVVEAGDLSTDEFKDFMARFAGGLTGG
jgi:hypothetical protein